MSLEVQTDLTELRWSHNGGPSITEWEGKSNVTIENVRKADEGIYECYNDGARDKAKHAIMRLVVRGKSLLWLTLTGVIVQLYLSYNIF